MAFIAYKSSSVVQGTTHKSITLLKINQPCTTEDDLVVYCTTEDDLISHYKVTKVRYGQLETVHHVHCASVSVLLLDSINKVEVPFRASLFKKILNETLLNGTHGAGSLSWVPPEFT